MNPRALSLALAACVLLGALAWFALSRGTTPVATAVIGRAGDAPASATSIAAPETPERTTATELRPSTAPAPAQKSAKPSERLVRHPVRARLVATDGLPIEDGSLEVRAGERTASAACGTDGAVEVAIELPGEVHGEIRALARGCAARKLYRALGAGDSSWIGDLELEPGGSIAGRVVDARGAPAASARVVAEPAEPLEPERVARLRVTGPSGAFGKAPFYSQAVDADDEGRFRIEHLAAGHWRVWAGKGDHLWALEPEVTLRPREDRTGVDLALELADPSTEIRGRVVDPLGAPVPEQRIIVSARQRLGWQQVSTDRDGRFAIAAEDGEPRKLSLEPPVWEWSKIEIAEARAGEQLELAFEDAQWLWVRVVDEQGAPLSNGRVSGLKAVDNGYLDRVISELWPDGRARLHRPREDFRLALEIPGFERTVSGPYSIAKLADPIQLTAVRGRLLRGRVTAAGSPLADAKVRRVWPSRDGKLLLAWRWEGEGEPFVSDCYGANLLQFVSTAADGTFALAEEEGRQTSSYHLRVEAPGHADALVGPFRSDSAVQDVEIALLRGGSLSGRLALAPSGDVTGWSVRAHDGHGKVIARDVGPDGRYLIEHLAPGGWQVSAFAPGSGSPGFMWRPEAAPMRSADAMVVEGETCELDLTATESRATLVGRLSIRGEALGPWQASARATDRTLPGQAVTLDPDGRFRMTLKTGVEYALALHGANSTHDHMWVEDSVVPAAGENHWELELELGRIRGSYRGPQPEAGQRIHLTHVWQGSGKIRVRSSVAVRDGGDFGPFPAHAGRGELRVDDTFGSLRALGYADDVPAPKEQLPPATVVVPSGGEIEVEYP